MKKLFMLAAMFMMGITATSAQEIRDMFGTDQKGDIGYGVRVGLNISNINGEYGPGPDGKLDLNARAGFQFGGVVDLPITNGFYIQPGLSFTTRGARQKQTIREAKLVNSFRPMYLQIPVLASFRADVCDKLNVQVNVGPHFAMGLGGKSVTKYSAAGESSTGKIPFFGKSSGDEEHFGAQRFDCGLTFGAGVTFMKHYYVGIAYDLGLVNMAIDEELGKETKLHNRNFSIQIGYNF